METLCLLSVSIFVGYPLKHLLLLLHYCFVEHYNIPVLSVNVVAFDISFLLRIQIKYAFGEKDGHSLSVLYPICMASLCHQV